jgi:hypothetical protein
VFKPQYHKKKKFLACCWWLTSIILAAWEVVIGRGLWFKASWYKQFIRLHLENTQQQQKKADEVAHVVECLSSKCEALNSNPTTAKKKKLKLKKVLKK